MTRKRFVKLLMSKGVDRNLALEYAAFVPGSYWIDNNEPVSYREFYIVMIKLILFLRRECK